MTPQNGFWRAGGLQSGAALGLAGVTAAVLAAASWSQNEHGGRLALLGVAVFAVGLALGRSRVVAVASLPVLGGALIATAADADPAWVRSIVLGCLWYLAVELAWEGIERRDGAGRTRAFNARRIDEITTVVTLSLVVTAAGVLLAFLAPVRTMFVVALVISGLLVVLRLTTRRLRKTGG